MTDKTHNKQAHELIEAGTITVVKGEADAFDGYLELAAGLSRLAGKFATTQKMTAELRRIIENAQLKGKSFHVIHGNLLVGIPDNKADGSRASNLRKALIWMHENAEQLAFARDRTASIHPLTLWDKWKKHQSSVIKEAIENGDDHLKLADHLEGVNQKEAKELLDAALKAKAKRESADAEKAQDTVGDDVAVLKEAIDHADLEELEALQVLIKLRVAKLTPKPAPKKRAPAKAKAEQAGGAVISDIKKKADGTTFRTVKFGS